MLTARIFDSLAQISAEQWDALHDRRNPFVAHAFLAGLEQYGCLRSSYGWTPQHLTLWEGDTLVAAAPGYLKSNSHGEFVFDHAWAQAYARYGVDQKNGLGHSSKTSYYPKWLCAVPYTPVTGPRLLARDPTARRALRATIVQMIGEADLSSAHINFHGADEDDAFDESWLQRLDVQYHWRNDSGWQTFDKFLAAMDHKHRKNIRQERARVQRAGVAFRVVHGDDASEDDLATMHGFYLRTFADYGNTPALTLGFLRHLASSMPRQLVLMLAEREGETIAGALCLRGGDTLYGRYWGARPGIDQGTVPGLHFETCYYQGIDYCLREGLRVFEPGAQGEHKLARGFLPTLVRSRHWIADPTFAQALREWCAQETVSVRRYAAQLAAHSPFRRSSV